MILLSSDDDGPPPYSIWDQLSACSWMVDVLISGEEWCVMLMVWFPMMSDSDDTGEMVG